jgi:hypothetical protein
MVQVSPLHQKLQEIDQLSKLIHIHDIDELQNNYAKTKVAR